MPDEEQGVFRVIVGTLALIAATGVLAWRRRPARPARSPLAAASEVPPSPADPPLPRTPAKASRPEEPPALRVSIVAPSPGARLCGQLRIDADLSGTTEVERVEFDVNGQPQTTSTEPPFRFDLDTTALPNGPATLRMVAYGADGLTQSASSVRVRIAN